ncbi:MAG TPA: serine/threonine-protein kinase [Trebonia sp.]|nr:serine/threonine-protein kinase [Trebonia sp.]
MTGRVIAGRYNLAEPIGRGAMGGGWRARDTLLDRDVAVKEVVLSAAIGEDERQNAYQRTLREARTAARLSHRGVVTVYDVAEEDGRPWIVMELVPSRSLEQVLFTDGPLPPRRAGRIGQQLLAALAAAHAAGVLHRDVKPSNVLIAPDGFDSERAVLTDFGIAQFEGDPRLTQTGMVMGSPGFTAPERIRGDVATPASDLWSLGATIYAALEGRGPYEQRGGAITTMTAIINEDAPIAPSAGRLGPLIAALLRREPAARPSAARAARMFAEVLPTLPGHRPGAVRHAPTLLSEVKPAPAVATSSDAARKGSNGGPARAGGGLAGQALAEETVVKKAAAAQPPPAPSAAASDADAAHYVVPDAVPGALGEETIASAGAPAAGVAGAAGAAGAAGEAPDADSAESGELAASAPAGGEPVAGPAETAGEEAAAATAVLAAPPAAATSLDKAAGGLPDAKPPVWASGFWREDDAVGESGGRVRENGSLPAPPGPTFSPASPASPPGQWSAPPPAPGYAPPAAPAYRGSGRPPARRRRGRVLAVAAAAAIVVIAAVVVLVTRPDASAPPKAASTSTTANGNQPSSVQAIDSPAVKLPASWSTEVASGAVEGTTAGFSIGLPPGWQVVRHADATFLEAPDGVRYLEVDLAAHHFQNMVTEARYIEKTALVKGSFPGYRLISIKPEEIRGTAGSFWAFTWKRGNGLVMRVDDLLFTLPTSAGPQSYAVYFTAPASESGMSQRLTFFDKLLRTFQPVTG